ncbi:hypothetical protein BJ508DRAFT_224660 [Ascobolus immersus RN42]|uniref:Spindle pole body component n=1 Tax=Ascobolus immersus RN42 TaxID=1160509 RepID=A0A3N4I9P7_ASCIM|nr:hypothetical protein BJ508DRAFT_224660 [Ascobolus immersus RN42]
MIHELFLLLYGHESPILTPKGVPKGFPLLSPSEREILLDLATLGHTHIGVRKECAALSSSHQSPIVRAVASAIITQHLADFRTKITNVEAAILKRDASVVGAYDVVPLATIVSEFDGWDRRLEYLHDFSCFLSAIGENEPVNGARVIDRLRKDIHTGYPDLEDIAIDLLKIAETTWLRQVSTWVLYGRLPTFGSTDFFIAEGAGEEARDTSSLIDDMVLKSYAVNHKLVPKFVDYQTSSSILFIGKALSHIRTRGAVSSLDSNASGPALEQLATHAGLLKALTSPLSAQRLSSAISSIRSSLSKNILQRLLPTHQIVETIEVLREFFLLGRGEFAVNLVEQASIGVRNRLRRLPGGGNTETMAAPQSSKGTIVREGEVAAILSRTWGTLSNVQSDNFVDEHLELARDLIYLTVNKTPIGSSTPKKPNIRFDDLLIGVPVSLSFHLTWPLELFLSQTELEMYNYVFAYLLAVRKSYIAVQGLWLGRRYPPEAIESSPEASRARRLRRTGREKNERFIWATTQLASFFLETISGYWQGDVIEAAYGQLMDLLHDDVGEPQERPPTSGANHGGDGESIWTAQYSGDRTQHDVEQRTRRDPETLMKAHNFYLASIKKNLFITDTEFPILMREFLTLTTTLVADVERLNSRRNLQMLDIPGVGGREEEARDLGNARHTCDLVKEQISKLVERLHYLDEQRTGSEGSSDGAKIDRLLMRLGLSNLRSGGNNEDEMELSDEEME